MKNNQIEPTQYLIYHLKYVSFHDERNIIKSCYPYNKSPYTLLKDGFLYKAIRNDHWDFFRQMESYCLSDKSVNNIGESNIINNLFQRPCLRSNVKQHYSYRKKYVSRLEIDQYHEPTYKIVKNIDKKPLHPENLKKPYYSKHSSWSICHLKSGFVPDVFGSNRKGENTLTGIIVSFYNTLPPNRIFQYDSGTYSRNSYESNNKIKLEKKICNQLKKKKLFTSYSELIESGNKNYYNEAMVRVTLNKPCFNNKNIQKLHEIEINKLKQITPENIKDFIPIMFFRFNNIYSRLLAHARSLSLKRLTGRTTPILYYNPKPYDKPKNTVKWYTPKDQKKDVLRILKNTNRYSKNTSALAIYILLERSNFKIDVGQDDGWGLISVDIFKYISELCEINSKMVRVSVNLFFLNVTLPLIKNNFNKHLTLSNKIQIAKHCLYSLLTSYKGKYKKIYYDLSFSSLQDINASTNVSSEQKKEIKVLCSSILEMNNYKIHELFLFLYSTRNIGDMQTHWMKRICNNRNSSKMIKFLLRWGDELIKNNVMEVLIELIKSRKFESAHCIINIISKPKKYIIKNDNNESVIDIILREQYTELLDHILCKYPKLIDCTNILPDNDTLLIYTIKKISEFNEDNLNNNEYIKIITTLLNHNPNIQIKNIYSKNALMYSIEEKNIETLRLLLQKQSDYSLKGNHYLNILEFAAKSGDQLVLEEILKYFKLHEITIKNKHIESTIKCARDAGKYYVMKMLKRHRKEKHVANNTTFFRKPNHKIGYNSPMITKSICSIENQGVTYL